MVLLLDDSLSDVRGSDWEVILWLDDDLVIEQIGDSRIVGDDVCKFWNGLDYVLYSFFVVWEV